MKPLISTPCNDHIQTSTVTSEEVKQYVSMVKGRLQVAIESPIFICGMAPLDPNDPCHELFLYDTSLDCDSHVEAEFYVSRVQPSRLDETGNLPHSII